MADISLRIDGKEVKVKSGMTILEAAKSVGVFIPTLCYREALSSSASCQLCSVELISGLKSEMVTSCICDVAEGMDVKTKSKKLSHYRKVILELILAEWPSLDKKLLDRYGIEQKRFEEQPTFCPVCGLCVRYCSEVKKANVLGFVGKGIDLQVVMYTEKAMKYCPTCDKGRMGCRSICPTGIIPENFVFGEPRLGKKLPKAYPLRLYDEENVRKVMYLVGDKRMPVVRKYEADKKREGTTGERTSQM
jgi:bidirectional [NiFe] hydrogenase diaphorase subunit